MRRILYLSRGGCADGSQTQLRYVLDALAGHGYEAVVFCREEGPFVESLRSSGLPVYSWLLRAWRKWPEGLLRGLDARRLARLGRRHGVCLVHSSDMWLGGYTGSVSRRLAVPSVLHVRGPKDPEELRKHGCLRASAVVAISPRAHENILRAGVPKEKAVLVPDSVDLRAFIPRWQRDGNVLRRRFSPTGEVLVGLVGRVYQAKRQLDFLRAARRVLARTGRRVTFFVVGQDHDLHYADSVRRLAAEQDLAGNVVFTGRRDDMPEVLAGLDVLVSMSGGSVMIEGLACGCAVLSAAFSTPQQSRIVRDGVTGLVIPSGNPDQVAGAMVRLIEDDALRDRLGRQGRRWVEQHYSHEVMVRRTVAVYDRLLAGLPPAEAGIPDDPGDMVEQAGSA